MSVLCLCIFFFEGYGDHRDLHVLTHSFPTRRSSDLRRSIGRWCSRWQIVSPISTSSMPTTAQTSPAVTSSTRSEEHTSELQSLMRISYAVFCLKKRNTQQTTINSSTNTA